MESEHFIFDGVKSSDMGLMSVRMSSNTFVETPFWGGADIKEELSHKKITPYFYGVQRKPIEFKIQCALMDSNGDVKQWTPQDRSRIARWLIHDEYKEFQTVDDLGKRYFAICTNDVNLNLINTRGYIELSFKTNSPYAWSPIYVDKFDLSNNEATTIIELENKSNVVKEFNPLIEIELVNGETNIELKNLSNSGKAMRFEGLYSNEVISIDTQNKIIKSNLQGSNPFSKFNTGTYNKRYWLDLVYGINQISVNGKCIIYTKMRFPIAQ